ncbi:unnamed protein product [Spodoptera exigua]|nr:unnamed protein product [Spodoptera exigua]
MDYRGGLVRNRGCVFGDGSSIRNWGRVVCYGGDHFSNRGNHLGDGSNNLGDMSEGFLVYNSVETVVGVSSVLNSALGTVRVYHGVGAVHNITITSLVLALGVTGVSVLYIIREAVLGVGVIGLNLGNRGSVCHGGSNFGHGSGGVVCRSGLHSVAGVGEGSRVGHLSSW